MNDYKELIECLKIRSEYNRDGGFWNEGVSDSIDAAIKAIEQLVKERDAAVKCIEDIETYLQMGSAKYIDKTIKEWRGVQE